VPTAHDGPARVLFVYYSYTQQTQMLVQRMAEALPGMVLAQLSSATGQTPVSAVILPELTASARAW
jgi:hypothetical protein